MFKRILVPSDGSDITSKAGSSKEAKAKEKDRGEKDKPEG